MHKISRSLGLICADLLREPLFLIGLGIKILIIIFLIPVIQENWFVPFIINWIQNPFSSPWTSHIAAGGDSLAFPYGITMFIFHLPTTAFGWMADQVIEVEYFSSFGFRFSLLLADFILLLVLIQAYEGFWKKIIIFYWLSPLVLFITYWHGQTDIIPVALFLYSLILLKRTNLLFAAIFLALAISAKHSMVIGVPFVIYYLWSHSGIHKEFQRFLIVFISILFLLEAPFFVLESFQLMVLENPEMEKLYWLDIEMGSDLSIYLTPLAYLMLLYFFWRIRRVNFDLLVASLGVAFSVVILMTPSSPGWYLWLVPILAIHQSRHGSGAIILVGIFSLLFIFYHIFYSSGSSFLIFDLNLLNILNLQNINIQSIHYTILISFGILIAIQIWREGVRDNDYYLLGSRPLVLGIGGDSGVGKSTFSKGLATIFGERSLVEVSGDDYHNWDRSSPMWKTLTHLNPKANRLFDLVRDVRSLLDGNEVRARQYDHKTGLFKPKKIISSKNVVLVEGLHTFYPQQLLEELDVRIFLDMDERLRVFLRVKRDIKERDGDEDTVIKELDRRKDDSNKYIKPQAKRADVIFKIIPINIDLLEQNNLIDSNTKLRVTIKNGVYYQELVKVLIGVCALQVNIESIDDRGEVILEISGDVGSEDVELAINMLASHIEELLNFGAEFSSGAQGIMQIITILEVDEALKRRKSSL
jgi:uridine kinase